LKKIYVDYSSDPDYLNTVCYASIYFEDYNYARKILPTLKKLSPDNPNIAAYKKMLDKKEK